MASDQPDHAAIFETLVEVAEDPDPTRLRLTLDNGRTVTGGVVDPILDRDPDIDTATVDLSLEFSEAIEVELPDSVDEDTGISSTGLVRAEKRRGDIRPIEVCLTSASREVEYPVVGEVESVDRIPED